MSPTDDAEACCALGHVEEAGELNQLVARVAESGGEQADAVFPRFAAIVSGWQREAARGRRPLPTYIMCLRCSAAAASCAARAATAVPHSAALPHPRTHHRWASTRSSRSCWTRFWRAWSSR